MQSDIHAFERTVQRTKNIFDSKIKDRIEFSKEKIEAIILDNDLESDINIEILHNKIDSLPKNKAESLNPTAFIFGFYVIIKEKNNFVISKKILDNVFSSKRFENILKEDNIEKVDVIRYARFWISTEK